MHAYVHRLYCRINASPSGWVLLVALAVLPTMLYWFAGYSGDDFKFHTTSWIELHKAFAAHSWEFGWSAGAHQGLGSPRLCFYPPFNVLISTLLSFLLPYRLVPGVLIWMILSTAGLSMYAAAGRLGGRRHRITAAILFMFSGYMLLATMRRYDAAECWVDAVLPLTFLYYYRTICEDESRAIVPAALFFAFGWLTNVPAAIIGLYTLGVTAALVCLLRRRLRPLLLFACVEGAALGVAAFRLVPTLLEKKWIHANGLLLFSFERFMLMRRVPPHQLQAWFLNFCLVVALLLVVSSAWLARRTAAQPLILTRTLLILVGIAVFFETPASSFLWRHLPELAFVQFPWRFQTYLTLAVPILLFTPGVGNRLRGMAAVLYVPLAIFPFVNTFHEVPALRFPNIAAALTHFEGKYEGVPEYLPAAAPIDVKEPFSVKNLRLDLAGKAEGCDAGALVSTPNRQTVTASSPNGCRLTVGTLCYPFWQARLEEGTALPLQCTDGGLLTMHLPAGKHRVELSFQPHSTPRTLAACFSALVLLVLLWLGARLRTGRTDEAGAAAV